jgi:hypothetical protein
MLIGETEADESPLEPGVWHLPRYAVETSPPTEWPNDKWPRWNGSSWDLVTRPTPTEVEADDDPVSKLRAFLAANPDVAAVLNQGNV